VDVFGHDQAARVAYGWNIDHARSSSYSVYTPACSRLNQDFLRRDEAPDRILFPHTIDGTTLNSTAGSVAERSLDIARIILRPPVADPKRNRDV
jgi:hypothetical protein